MASFHESFVDREEISASSERSFGLIVGGAAVLLWLWRLWQHGNSFWPALVGASLIGLAWLWPKALYWPNRGWFHFGNLLNKLTTPFVMGFVFFLVLTPIALVRRALGADDLRLKPDPNAGTWWIEREPPGPDPLDLERQF